MRIKVMIMFGLAIGLCDIFAGSANAQCGVSLTDKRPVFTTQFPSMREEAKEEVQAEPLRLHGAISPKALAPTIVGLWDVKFISNNEVVDEGFDQYHSDGTEILNDTPPPATGNVCLGIYAAVGASIKLKHPSWIYDPTNSFVIGRATILEQISVDSSGRFFTGVFTIQFRDLSGNPLAPDFSGQLRGDRITPE